VLEHDVDVSRGDMIVGLEFLPGASTELQARVCWMHPRALQRGKKYLLKHTTQTVQAAVTDLASRINIQTFDPEPAPPELAMNDIGEITSPPSPSFLRLRGQASDRFIHFDRARKTRLSLLACFNTDRVGEANTTTLPSEKQKQGA
jgi:hypothetical protein